MPKLFDGQPEDENRQALVRVRQRHNRIEADLVDQFGKEWEAGMLFSITSDGTLSIYSMVNAEAAEKAGLKLSGSNNCLKYEVF